MNDTAYSNNIEDRASAETELAELTRELNDLIRLNSDLHNDNNSKDATILRMKEQLAIMTERNSSEFEQIDIEDHCHLEQLEYDLAIETKTLTKLHLEIEKLKQLDKEIKLLNSSIKDSSKQQSEHNLQFAHTFHHINNELRNHRVEIEKTLKKELIRIDNYYQKKSYDHLSDDHKEYLLTRSMLYDEIALQNIGKSSLETRLRLQDKIYEDYHNEAKLVNQNAKKIRDQLGNIAKKRKLLNNIVSDLLAEEVDILSYKSNINTSNKPLHSSILELKSILNKELNEISTHSLILQIWSKALKDIENIYITLEKTKDIESKTMELNQNEDIFALDYSLSSLTSKTLNVLTYDDELRSILTQTINDCHEYIDLLHQSLGSLDNHNEIIRRIPFQQRPIPWILITIMEMRVKLNDDIMMIHSNRESYDNRDDTIQWNHDLNPYLDKKLSKLKDLKTLYEEIDFDGSTD